MTNKYRLLKNYITNAEKALFKLKESGLTFLDQDLIWQILVYELDHYDIPTEVLFHALDEYQIVNIITEYFIKYGRPAGNITLSNTIVPVDHDALQKARIKHRGEIWIIHKNDADPFPSSPHAHNYESQLKLHLGNGDLYRKTTYVDCINKKDLIIIREKISSTIDDVILPPLQF